MATLGYEYGFKVMSETPSHDDIVKLIIEKGDKSTHQFEENILAVYSQPENIRAKPDHVGTAFFINIKHSIYLVTACHVIKNSVEMGSTLFLNKKGRCFTLGELTANNETPIFCTEKDLFIIRVGGVSSGIDAMVCSIFDRVDIPDVCVSIGFPNSKNKKGISPKSKAGKLVALKVHLYNISAKGEKINHPESPHFFYKWGEKVSLSEELVEKNSIGLRGMSGAPCFYVPITSENILNAENLAGETSIAGILIEHKDEVITFTRASEILNLISGRA
ncbi:hypothetical protein [Halomonas sp. MS1]|nr:hypothetical protein [Halomonas sp. MS1]UTD55166.1 hypothetical protein NF683_18785 [Halomonas sp. MS1]